MKTTRVWIFCFILLNSAAASAQLPCDVNGDHQLSADDAWLCLEKYLGRCPSAGIPCEELSCDVNGDGETTPEDARQILLKALGKSSDCGDPSSCVQCRLDQHRAKQALESLADNILAYLCEYHVYPDSIEKLSCFFPHTALYDYTLELGDAGYSFVLTARSKAPGIAGKGGGDDVWTRDQHRHFVHVKDACPECDPLVCLSCLDRQKEAKAILRAIARDQEAYKAEYDSYAKTLTQLGVFEHSRYFTFALENVSQNTFKATAIAREPGVAGGGAGDDAWTIDGEDKLVHVKDACPECAPLENRCVSCRDKQLAARQNLEIIAKSQAAYFAEYDTYADSFDALGFSVSGSDRKHYAVTLENVTSSTYTVIIRSKAPGIMGKGAGDDHWSMDADRDIRHVKDACFDCPDFPRHDCADCQDKQAHAVFQLKALWEKMETYKSQHGQYTDALSELESPPASALYEYQIETDNSASPKRFWLTARSKSPGIAHGGQDDDVWTLDERQRLTHSVRACPLCPQSKELIYTGYKCQSKQGEARQTLGTIARYQEAYHFEYQTYADSFEKLGLNPNTGDSRRYEYTLSQVQPDGFVAIARSKAPGIGLGGRGDDVWTLNQDLELTNPVNGCEWMGAGAR